MKKLALSLFALLSLATQAQTVVKLNVPNILVGLYDVQVEHAISEKNAIQLGIGFMPKRDLIFRDFLTKQDQETFKDLEEELFTGMDFNGFRITPEYKLYTGEDGAKGVYFDFWAKFSSYSLDNENYIQDYDNISGNSTSDEFTLDGSITNIGAGVGIGTQWFIKDLISIDILWLGLGYNHSSFKAQYSTDAVDVDWDQWEADAKDESSIYSKIGDPEFEQTEDGLKMTLASKLPIILRGGISIGVKF